MDKMRKINCDVVVVGVPGGSMVLENFVFGMSKISDF
jgi:hypothetical protein